MKKKVLAYFRLVRVGNLLIIALIMYLLRYLVFAPALAYENIASPIDDFQFAWLVLTYIFITAGGYAINDYYDIGMDEINHPDKTVLRNAIPLAVGQNLFFVLTAIGVLMGCGLAWVLQSTSLYFIPVFVAAMYWFYSTKYKREFISGNLVVSLLAALSILIVFVYYILAFAKTGDFPVGMYGYIKKVIFVYAAFAFYITFIREVIKDVADMEGDKEFECSNIPLRYGIKTTRIVLWALSIVFLAVLIGFAYYSFQLNRMYLLYYIVILLIPLFLYFLRGLYKAKEKKDYNELSLILKLYMVAGIFSLQLLSMSYQWK